MKDALHEFVRTLSTVHGRPRDDGVHMIALVVCSVNNPHADVDRGCLPEVEAVAGDNGFRECRALIPLPAAKTTTAPTPTRLTVSAAPGATIWAPTLKNAVHDGLDDDVVVKHGSPALRILLVVINKPARVCRCDERSTCIPLPSCASSSGAYLGWAGRRTATQPIARGTP